jgi:predicted unusual protein kinase regulating ubiquinone biosynthesis (AarF/ABC1/UbiB family)
VPVSAARRLFELGGLQAQVAVAYLVYWLRSWFKDASQRELELAETHLRAAIDVFATMGYLRGAAMKVGQAIANLPDLLPTQVEETLERLHFEAPPMHFALLREQVRNELGQDPESVFASFETDALAAASLGQVHRATLASGEQVAVKIQYPGIARSIRADFRALSALLFPTRLTQVWESLKGQFEDIRAVLERETDYELEAETLTRGRALFREDDGIVVPNVFDAYSTRRVLTMEFVEGVHVQDFLKTDPPQEQRDQFGEKIYGSGARLHFAGRLLYADPHPGNYLFLPNGELGLIDFGCVRPYNDQEWECCRLLDPAVRGDRETRREVGRLMAAIDDPAHADPKHLDLLEAYSDWMWRPYNLEAPFDFGSETYLREGIDLMSKLIGGRYTQGRPMVVFTTRWFFGMVAMLHRLRARVDVGALYNQERVAAEWTTA